MLPRSPPFLQPNRLSETRALSKDPPVPRLRNLPLTTATHISYVDYRLELRDGIRRVSFSDRRGDPHVFRMGLGIPQALSRRTEELAHHCRARNGGRGIHRGHFKSREARLSHFVGGSCRDRCPTGDPSIAHFGPPAANRCDHYRDRGELPHRPEVAAAYLQFPRSL